MRWFVTGATGFLGGRVVSTLLARGEDVRALVRSRERGSTLEAAGCELVVGDLSVVDPHWFDCCDRAIHAAASYLIGVDGRQAAAMRDANVEGTRRILAAASTAGTPVLVYVSTQNVFGDTRGVVVDEEYHRPPERGFLSAYDETKVRAHELVQDAAASGLPVVTVMPGVIYGPGDTSQLGGQIAAAMRGTLRYTSFPTLGVNAVYVDDVVDGLLLAVERGVLRREYVLGGDRLRMRELIAAAAAATGRRPPRITMPTWAIRLSAPLGPVLGHRLGLPPNLTETIRASHDVTYWGSDARARTELGYAPRSLADGLEATAQAEGLLPVRA